MIKTDNEARVDDREREAGIIADIIKTKTADEWEVYFQARHVPAARVRTMAEALADPHFTERRVFHKFDAVAGIDGPVAVPLAAFKFAHGGPSIETRRTRWAPTPMRCSPNTVTAQRRSPAFAAPG